MILDEHKRQMASISRRLTQANIVLPSNPGELGALKLEVFLKTIDGSRRHRHFVHAVQGGAERQL